MKAVFIYASSEYDFQCFIFHDVDPHLEDDRNMYSCPIFPRHMSVTVDEINYKYVEELQPVVVGALLFFSRLTYEELIGGVLNIRSDHFLTVNGYSHLYWGWGAEDDDLFYRWEFGVERESLTVNFRCRLKEVSRKVIRPPATIARYKMLQHTKR